MFSALVATRTGLKILFKSLSFSLAWFPVSADIPDSDRQSLVVFDGGLTHYCNMN